MMPIRTDRSGVYVRNVLNVLVSTFSLLTTRL